MPSWFSRLSPTTSATATPDKIAASTSDTSAVSSASNLKTESLSTTDRPQRARSGFSAIANTFTRLRLRQSQPSFTAQSPVQGGSASHLADAARRLILAPPSRSREGRLTERLTRPRNGARSTEGLTLPSYAPTAPTSTEPKIRHLVSLSGNFPITQPGIRESILKDTPKSSVVYNEVFEVLGGVNTSTLLRATRKTILEVIGVNSGANALIDEQWICTICGPREQVYKVQINYSATAVCCTNPDGFSPVALDKARSVPGLMTITKRNLL